MRYHQSKKYTSLRDICIKGGHLDAPHARRRHAGEHRGEGLVHRRSDQDPGCAGHQPQHGDGRDDADEHVSSYGETVEFSNEGKEFLANIAIPLY